MWQPQSCPEPRGESQSHGETWRPWSCPELGGGSQSRGDTWRPWSCPELGGGSHCLDLKVVREGTRSSGYRQWPPGPPRERLRTRGWG
jgi:hypothetical protein